MDDLNQRTGLDDIDVEILRLLQDDASISKAELGRRLNLSQPAVHHRVKRLEERGYIQRYVAILDHELLGLDLICFVQVEQAVLAMPEVLDCHHLTGDADFLLKVVAPNRKALEHLLVERLSTLPGVTHLETSVVLREVKHVTALPLE